MDKPNRPIMTVHSYNPEDFEDKCHALDMLGYKLVSSSCHPDPDRELQWAAVFALPEVLAASVAPQALADMTESLERIVSSLDVMSGQVSFT